MVELYSCLIAADTLSDGANYSLFPPLLGAIMDAENITLANALEAISDLFLRNLSQHEVGRMPAGSISPLALPIRELNPAGQQMKHFFDIIHDYDGRVSDDVLAPIIRDQAWDELPSPFGLKRSLDVIYAMQLFVIPQNNGNRCIVKHIFVSDAKIKASITNQAAYDTPHEVIWGTNAKNTKKALQFMLENLDGTQFRLFSLTPEVSRKTSKSTPDKSEEDLDKGFRYIREEEAWYSAA